MTEIRDSVVPLRLDCWEEEKVMGLRFDDGNFLSLEKRAGCGLFYQALCHPSDIDRYIKWVRQNVEEGDWGLTPAITTVSEQLARVRSRNGCTSLGEPNLGVWFPISGEVIPL
jgi:hypothetical protein